MISEVPRAAAARPFLFAMLPVLIAVAIETLFGILIESRLTLVTALLIGMFTGSMLCMIGAVGLTISGWWRAAGFRWPANWRSLLWFLPFFVYGLLPLVAGVKVSVGVVVVAAFAALIISFWKIAFFGFMLTALRPLGIWQAATGAALLYAVMHLGALLVGAALVPTLALSLSYLWLAFAYAAVKFRTNVIWPIVLANALLLTTATTTRPSDTPNLVASVALVIPALVVSALLALYGLFVLSRMPRHK